MKELKLIIVLHLILGPIGAWICANDWSHPELWGDWYRNPAYAKPFLIAAEVFIWSCVGYLVWRDRKDKRMADGMRKFEEAIRLLDQGRIKEADELYEQAMRLTGQR